MASFPVPAPIYGLNDDKPFSQQPPGTSQDVLNVRAQDPIEKRERISQRSGLADITGPTQSQVNGSNKVQHLAKVTFANQTVDYAELSDASILGTKEWGASFQGKAARHVKVDRQNNSYWIVGRDLLVKLNSAGAEVWRYTIPLKETTHQLRGLAIDSLANVWVSSGAIQDYSDSTFTKVTHTDVQENNQIWRISERVNTDLEEEPEITGEYVATGFIPDLAVANGFVYFIQNRPDAFEADLIILSGFGVNSLSTSSSPSVLAVRGIPYPANSLAVNVSGEIVVSCEPFVNRTENPKYPNLGKVSNLTNLPGMWTPHRNLPNTASLWSEHRPALEPQANGTAFEVLTDLTGNSRDISTQQAAATGDSRAGTFTDPTFIERVIGDAAGIRFNGTTSAMASQTNLNLEYQDRGGAQRTPWPSYGSSTGTPKVADDTCAQYVYFILARVVREATKGAIIGQRSDVEFPAGGPHAELPYALVANRPQGTLVTQAAESGKISLYDWVREAAAGDYVSDFTPQGSATANVRFPREGDLNGTRSGEIDEEVPEDPPVALITIMVDNAVDFASSDDAVMRGGWRLNGRPMDRGKGHIRISERRVTLGFADDTAFSLGDDHGMFNGDIVYMACVARVDPTDNTEPKVMEHQFTSRTSQRISMGVNATGGTFDLTVTYPDGTTETAANIPYNATAAALETGFAYSLESLGSMNAEDVTVTGMNLAPAQDIIVHMGYNVGAAKPTAPAQYPTGQYHGLQLPIFTADDTNLTGLGAPTSISIIADVEDGVAGDNQGHSLSSETDLERYEGWIMHEHGTQGLLPQPGELYAHPFAVNPPLDENAVDPTDLLSTTAILAKYGTGDLSLKWVETDKGGIGYGITINKDGNLVSVGPQQTSPADAIEYRFIADDGASVTFGANGKFDVEGFQDRHVRLDTDQDATVYIPRFPDAHVAVDDGGLGIRCDPAGAGIATFTRTTGSWVTDGFRVGEMVRASAGFDPATVGDWEVSAVTALNLTILDPGDTITVLDLPAASKTVTRLDYVTAEVFTSAGVAEAEYRSSATEDDVVGGYAAASPIARPEYGPGSTIDRDEFLFLATDATPIAGGTADNDTARKVRIVSATHNNSSPRSTKLYAVAGGGIRVWDGATSYASLGVEATGDDVLSSTSTFFSSAELFGKLYISDGVNPTRVINPFEVPLATGQVATHKAADGGEVPIARILFSWRGRLGWAHSPDSPHFWKLSEIGRPGNVNEFPPSPFVGQAISGLNSPETGEAPDIINTVVTGSEDYLLFGGDHSITALVGDPTSSGLIARGDLGQSIGQFQTISDSTGMAFGKSWARDKMDNIFFYSSRGEAFALRPGSKPEPISDRAIEKRLQQIDFSTHYVDAQWNWEDNCVHFFVIAYGAATAETHHVFDVQRGKMMQVEGGDPIAVGWWRDKFGHSDVQPTAVTVFDGDSPDDRALLIGCADGRVRKWDPNANNDGETSLRQKVKIDSYCTYGPLAPVGAGGEFMFTALEVDLDRNQSGALVEYLKADTGDFPQEADPTGIELFAGYNPPLHERVAGSYCGFRIRNSAADQRFSVDRVMIDASAMGDRRARV